MRWNFRRWLIIMKLETITLKIDTDLYEEANAIFEKEGYTVEEAIMQFLKVCIACGGFPFPVTEEELLAAQEG